MRIARWTLIGVLTAASATGAQVVHTRPTAGTGGTVAKIAPPPPVVIVVQNQQVFVPPGMFLQPNLPVLLLPDGRVFSNFGNGFQHVVRNCATTVTFVQPVTGQPTVVQPVPGYPTAQPVLPSTIVPNGVLVSQNVVIQPQPGLPTAQPIPYTQVVPNQPTASQQMLQQQILQQQIAAGGAVIVNTRACWSSNPGGQILIAIP